MPASRSSASARRFEETSGEVLRWATIADVAKRLGMDEREAILLAGANVPKRTMCGST
jgi:hypothetical protein